MAECLGAGCSFFGNAELDGYCSQCHKKLFPEKHGHDELWIRACTGAALGDVEPVRNYVHGTGKLDRRITAAEQTSLQNEGIFVESGATLLEIALARDNRDVTMFLTDGSAPEGDPKLDLLRQQVSSLFEDLPRTDSFRDKFGELDGPDMPEEVRGTLFSCRRSRTDGLDYLDVPHAPCGCSLFMPAEIASVDPGLKGRALGLLIEAKDTLSALKATVGWWADKDAAHMVPLYTSADLNCLLHACSLTLAGVRDTLALDESDGRCMLRDALYTALNSCEKLRDAVSNPRFAATTQTETGADRLEEVVSRARRNRTTLDGAHIFGLANVLRRPIICHAPPEAEQGEARHTLAIPFRMSGIYLPLMWEPGEACPDPLVIAYTQGHFTGLCPVQPKAGVDTVAIPLYDSESAPLPVPYAAVSSDGDDGWTGWAGAPPVSAEDGGRDCRDLLRRYVKLDTSVHGENAIMRVPPDNAGGILETYREVLRSSISRKLAEASEETAAPKAAPKRTPSP